MKKIILVGALLATAAFTSTAFAGADFSVKDGTNSNGSSIGQQSSAATGNGAVVGGHGSDLGGMTDQTTSPGSRAALVHASNGTPPGQANK